MKNTDVPSTRDHEIRHEIEFFEVSSYGVLGPYARSIGKHDATTLLEETLHDKALPTQHDSGEMDQLLQTGQPFENIANVSSKLTSCIPRGKRKSS